MTFHGQTKLYHYKDIDNDIVHSSTINTAITVTEWQAFTQQSNVKRQNQQ